jgi:hypothetical protein
MNYFRSIPFQNTFIINAFVHIITFSENAQLNNKTDLIAQDGWLAAFWMLRSVA